MFRFKRRRPHRESQSSDLSSDSSLFEKAALPPRKKATNSEFSGASPSVPETNCNMSPHDEPQDVLSKHIKTAKSSPEYENGRTGLVNAERGQAWDAPARLRASVTELKAQSIICNIREHERINLYGNLPSEAVPDPETRDMGGRFLVNKPTIKRSKIYDIAMNMPKGCHLHIHFNSELPPEDLLPHARSEAMAETMFIRSTQPLCSIDRFGPAEIVFNVLPKDTPTADIFSPSYNPDTKALGNAVWMRWRDFRNDFPKGIPIRERPERLDLDDAEFWVREKMIITVDHAYNERQTHNGAWACFNQGTRAFKGLLNYEGVYRWYIGAAIDSMIADRVMYAELRPMLLDKTIPSDDGTRQLGHVDQMTIICDEIERKREQLKDEGKLDSFPFGLKIIYCTPRSIPKSRMQTELLDCIKLKLRFPDLICGFDLVGAEDRPNNIGFYADILVGFVEACKELGISIPFMFHAGETLLDTGGSSNPDNSNLYDSLLLNAKRIGHGYSLLKHPLLVEKYKGQNICLELCPISNELLHLCGNAREHPYPALLAAGLHCTLNADNPSLFNSSLSSEFYQVMVGDTRMSVHGWKQLAEWSIEHSCLDKTEQERAMEIFRRDWENFCKWVVETYGEYAETLAELP